MANFTEDMQVVLVGLKSTLVMLDDIPLQTAHEKTLEIMYGKLEECVDMTYGILDAETPKVNHD